ncbi:MAG TPA: DUF3048 domain-containing protein [Anaerolineae bacterium]|nr:DUF3048 domain-containing protein [Anaerolineae bacterium]
MTIRILSNLPIRLFPFFLLIAFLLACGGNDVEPTARPIAPRPNPTATNAPSSIKANVPPTSQAQMIPTVSVATNVCPFTGLPLNGIQLAQRRPLLVKIGNSPPERPQSGLAQADIVIEHLTEGAITRFSAIFYCTDANDIGPIRSARLIDLELVPMFDAIFAHVGGSEPVRQLIAESEIAPDDFDDYGRTPIFREIEARKRPFNRYTSTQEMYNLAAKKGMLTNIPVPAFQFTSNVPSGGHTGNQVTVPYRPTLSDAVFTYDGQSKLYRRSIGTTPHVDADTNQQLTTANVIVLYAPHETTTIVEDSLGSRSIKITISGSGNATILRDGQAFDVTWSRNDPHALWQFTNANGQMIPLKPGNTWIEVVPPEMKIKVQ